MSDNKGLLFVFGEPGPNVSEEEFNDWYDNEHVPLRQTVDGFKSWLRYKAIDSQKPEWLALYDVTSPGVIFSDAYKAINVKATVREKELVSRTQLLNRRVYELLQYFEKPSLSASELPAKYVLTVAAHCEPENEEDFNNWYEEEHFPMIAKVPGWIRGRRYKLDSAVELAGQADKDAPPLAKFMSIHEWDRPDFMQLPEFQAMFKTSWAQKVYAYASRREPRRFELYKDFGGSK